MSLSMLTLFLLTATHSNSSALQVPVSCDRSTVSKTDEQEGPPTMSLVILRVSSFYRVELNQLCGAAIDY